MAEDPFNSYRTDPGNPAIESFAITPNDSADLPRAIRQIIIGTAAGTIAWQNRNGVTQTTGPLPVGTYNIGAHRIMASGTTATGLTGLV